MGRKKTIQDKKEYHRQWYAKNRKNILLKAAKRRAERKNLPFDLTAEWYDIAFGEGVCPILGLTYEEGVSSGWNSTPLAPSIDRIDPKKGYTVENCRIISYWANVSRSDWPEDLHYEYMQRAINQRWK